MAHGEVITAEKGSAVLVHDLRMASRSLRRHPILSVLTISTIAVGIAASMITITLYHSRAEHPIPWKDEQLFAVTLDARSSNPEASAFERRPEYPPFQLTYQDARALYQSTLPDRSVMMFATTRLVEPETKGARPVNVMARVTTADFFAMFDAPLLYGNAWSRSADDGPEPVVVISRYLNDSLFGGSDSVGRTLTLNARQFRVAGVLDTWVPYPKYYDLNATSIDLPEDVYLPFGWAEALQLQTAGAIECLSTDASIGSYQEILASECVWLQYWVEMSSDEQRAQFQQFVDAYVTQQKALGRFPRPLNNRIVNVSTWLEMNDVVGNASRVQVALAVMFLAVCILNTVGLILAKFLSAAPVAGLRRALGATRRDIVREHLTEVIVIGAMGGAAGTMLAWMGLMAIGTLVYAPALADLANPDRFALIRSLVQVDATMLLLAAVLALVSGVLAGLYPAWRVSRTAPASFLKIT